MHPSLIGGLLIAVLLIPMSKLFDFSVGNGFCPREFLFRNPKELSPFLSLGSHVDVYFPPRKRARVHAPFIFSEEPKEQPSIDILPDECLFEILRRLPGGQERSLCASVSKRWLVLLSNIWGNEICSSAAKDVEPEIEIVSTCKSLDESSKPKEKIESDDVNGVKSDDGADSRGYPSRFLEGKKATDVRLAAISVGTASRGGLGKLSIRGNSSTSRLTNLGLKAISCGCSSLRELSLWNVSSVGDEGLSAIANGCRSLEKLDLCHCPAITDKAIAEIARNCPNLRSVTLESCSNIGNESLKALGRHCRNLKNITLKNCPLAGDQGVASLFSLAGHVITKVNIQAIDISGVSLAVIGHYASEVIAVIGHYASEVIDLTLGSLVNVNEKGFWVMGKGRGLRKLTSLSLTSCHGVTDMVLEAISKGCPDLKTFALRKCGLVSDNGVVSFTKCALSLESLKFDEIHRITQYGVFGILASCCGKLKALAFSNCLGLRDLGSNLGFVVASPCSSLPSLTISNCVGFGDSGLTMIGGLCTKLSHLDLTGLNGITDSGLLPLVEKPEASLVKLSLTGCGNLTDDSVTKTVNLHGQTLKVLNLEGCRSITDKSLMSIATKCSRIQELDVSGSRITDSGVAILATAERLNLQVLSLAGCSFISCKSLLFVRMMARSLVGLNIQLCHRITSAAVNLLVEQLWRCDILC